MTHRYILEERQPVPCPDLMAWAFFMEDPKARRVDETRVGNKLVSTVFLGVDHQFGDGPPLLFETMVFSGPTGDGDEMERCSTWEEAVTMHANAVIRAGGV